MQLHVKSDVGAAVNGTVEADKTETVRELRDTIAGDQAVSAANISLTHKGEVLSPGDTLKQAGLKDGDTVRALPADPEGGSSPSSFSFSPKTSRQRLSNESRRVRNAGLPLRPVTPRRYQGTLVGKTIWEGQTYPVHIRLPDRYPHVPPTVRLEETPQPVHPNIAPDGSVCLAILNGGAWNKDYNVTLVYRTLQHLFESPNWDSPLYYKAYLSFVLFQCWRAKEGLKRVRR